MHLAPYLAQIAHNVSQHWLHHHNAIAQVDIIKTSQPINVMLVMQVASLVLQIAQIAHNVSQH